MGKAREMWLNRDKTITPTMACPHRLWVCPCKFFFPALAVVSTGAGDVRMSPVAPSAVDVADSETARGGRESSGLRFWKYGVSSNSVTFGLAWPVPRTFDLLNLYWNSAPAAHGWQKLAELDVRSAQSNAVFDIDRTSDDLFGAESGFFFATAYPDADGDLMPDWWEEAHGLSLQFYDADDDSDSDGLTNIQEYRLRTDPQNPDTDGDGFPDGWEVEHGLDPLDAVDAWLDSDNDYLSNLEEWQHGTDLQNPDTDGDGLPDGWEVYPWGPNYHIEAFNPLRNDANGDYDADGLTNIQETGWLIDCTDFHTSLA